MKIFQDIHNKVKELNLIEQRRDFHQYPEPGWAEFRTASIIAGKLRDYGFQVKVGKSIMGESRLGVPSADFLNSQYQRAFLQGGNPDFMESMKGGYTAVAGILNCGEGPVIAMRFDIDALDIEETTDPAHLPNIYDYRSKNNGVMHSCGHDGHATIGLGVAKIISELKQHFKGTIKLIFQPAEEGVRGAKSIATSGFLDDVDYIYACHLWSQLPLGHIICGMDGEIATTKYDAKFIGKEAHAGIDPDNGNNALLAAATAALNLHTQPMSSKGLSRVNVGKLNAGSGRNIIAGSATLCLETRGSNSLIDEQLMENSLKIIKNAADMYNCGLKLIPMGSAKAVTSDNEIAEVVKTIAEKIDIYENIIFKDIENRGSEDFTCMMERVKNNGGKACFIGIGANVNDSGHHTTTFDFNENALAPALETFLFTTYLLSNKR
ncbi:MAG: amidohydrolase [Hyphomicrobiales bacterium]